MSATATIDLEIFAVGSDTLTADGPAVVSRGDPYDSGSGQQAFDAEIVSMNLPGEVSIPLGLIRLWAGRQLGLPPSTGMTTQQTPGIDFPADSFFDVYAEIETTLPFPLGVLYNIEPIRMNAVIRSVPPWGAIYRPPEDQGRIPLLDEEGNTAGSITLDTLEFRPPPSPVPEFGVSIPIITSTALAAYPAFRKRIGKKLE